MAHLNTIHLAELHTHMVKKAVDSVTYASRDFVDLQPAERKARSLEAAELVISAHVMALNALGVDLSVPASSASAPNAAPSLPA